MKSSLLSMSPASPYAAVSEVQQVIDHLPQFEIGATFETYLEQLGFQKIKNGLPYDPAVFVDTQTHLSIILEPNVRSHNRLSASLEYSYDQETRTLAPKITIYLRPDYSWVSQIFRSESWDDHIHPRFLLGLRKGIGEILVGIGHPLAYKFEPSKLKSYDFSSVDDLRHELTHFLVRTLTPWGIRELEVRKSSLKQALSLEIDVNRRGWSADSRLETTRLNELTEEDRGGLLLDEFQAQSVSPSPFAQKAPKLWKSLLKGLRQNDRKKVEENLIAFQQILRDHYAYEETTSESARQGAMRWLFPEIESR